MIAVVIVLDWIVSDPESSPYFFFALLAMAAGAVAEPVTPSRAGIR